MKERREKPFEQTRKVNVDFDARSMKEIEECLLQSIAAVRSLSEDDVKMLDEVSVSHQEFKLHGFDNENWLTTRDSGQIRIYWLNLPF